LQKVHVEKEFHFFYEFLVLSRFRVFRSDGSSKTLQKRFAKKIVSKGFYKKSTKISRFWAFLGGGSSKTSTFFLNRKIESHSPRGFWSLTHHPLTTGVTDLFFCRPLAKTRNTTTKIQSQNAREYLALPLSIPTYPRGTGNPASFWPSFCVLLLSAKCITDHRRR
jgi:hypothetical protein